MRMKKLFAGFFAIASIAVVGCSHEESVTMNDGNEVFNGIIEMPMTRTSMEMLFQSLRRVDISRSMR